MVVHIPSHTKTYSYDSGTGEYTTSSPHTATGISWAEQGAGDGFFTPGETMDISFGGNSVFVGSLLIGGKLFFVYTHPTIPAIRYLANADTTVEADFPPTVHNFNDSAIDTTTVFTCFARGTRIATPDAEVAVEDLQIGDVVQTAAPGRTTSRSLPDAST